MTFAEFYKTVQSRVPRDRVWSVSVHAWNGSPRVTWEIYVQAEPGRPGLGMSGVNGVTSPEEALARLGCFLGHARESVLDEVGDMPTEASPF